MKPAEVKDAVKRLGGVAKMARSLRVSRSTVYRWMKAGIKT
jgi:DNA-binding phage protein